MILNIFIRKYCLPRFSSNYEYLCYIPERVNLHYVTDLWYLPVGIYYIETNRFDVCSRRVEIKS